MQLLFAPGGGYYRKPFAGMFYLLATKLNDGVPIDAASSLYVGDAAGRPASTAGTKDHSASDLQFALNCGACAWRGVLDTIGRMLRVHH